MKIFKNKKISSDGFTFIETMVYVFVMTIIIMTISSLFLSAFNARKQSVASYLIYNDARFIANYLNNRVHNVGLIQDASLPSEYLFYNMSSARFDLILDGTNLLYRETLDEGSGFPEQSTAEAITLNSRSVRVESFDLTAVSDSDGNPNQGIKIDFLLATGQPEDTHAYKEKAFSFFISLR